MITSPGRLPKELDDYLQASKRRDAQAKGIIHTLLIVALLCALWMTLSGSWILYSGNDDLGKHNGLICFVMFASAFGAVGFIINDMYRLKREIFQESKGNK